MSVIHGRKVQVYSGTSGTTKLIALAKSCTVQTQCEKIEKSSATNGAAREFLPGRSSWTAEITHLVADTQSTGALKRVGEVLTVRFLNESNEILRGQCFISDAKLQFTEGNLGNGSLKLQGTGALT
jgi:hypothetical protein